MNRPGGERWGVLVGMAIVLALGACGGGSSSSGGGGPGAPSGVTAVSNDSGEVTLDWGLVAGATSYSIYWDTASGLTKASGTKISGVFPPQDHTGIASGTTYYYVITASAGSAEGLESAEVSSTPLESPAGFAARGETGRVTLAWNAVAGATSYNIYWSNDPGITKANGTLAAGVSSPYTHFGLTDGMTYFYVVTALDSSGGGAESSESTAVFAMPLGPPTGPGAAAGSGEVTLDWGAVAEATSYNVYWSTTPGVTPATGSPIGGVNPPYTQVGLVNYTTYYYVVTATNLVGDGAESVETGEVSATPDIIGVLDADFDGLGFVLHDNAAGGMGSDTALAITTDGNGRVLMAGTSRGPNGNDDAVIWAYDPGGTLDGTFNGQGWLALADAAGGMGTDAAEGIAIDGLGRIVAAGYSRNAANNLDVVVWRLDADGTPDLTFGGQGWVVQDNRGGLSGQDLGMGVALDASGRILVCGESDTGSGSRDMAVWRFDPDGSLDTTFGGQGWITHDGAAGGSGFDTAAGIALDGSGRIVVVGRSFGGPTSDDLAVWRLDPDGSLDTSFNGQGWVTHHDAAGGNGPESASDVVLDSSGRILVTGWSYSATSFEDMVVWRFTSGGTLDAAFNGRGVLVHPNAGGGDDSDVGMDITLDPLGRILVAGYSLRGPQSIAMILWRINPDGTLDTSFDGDGWIVTPSSQPPVGDIGTAISLDALGRVLVAGQSFDPGFAVDMVAFRVK